MMGAIEVHPEVEQALRAGRPVVALESALITSGMPSSPQPRPAHGEIPGWDASQPAHLEVARLLERTVRDGGAVPATVGVVGGALRIGLDGESLRRLARDTAGSKASARDLAHVMHRGQTAGTTVSGTLAACRLSEAGPIRVLATGGIGGVHRGWTGRPDISPDLRQLAATAVCVISSGVKSVLDVAATVEALEALAVPVVAFGTDRFPQFYSRGSDELRAPGRLDDPAAVAAMCRTHWETLRSTGGILVANPVPEELGLDPAEIERHVTAAYAEAQRLGITGEERTPHLLAVVMARTEGRAMDANVGLLVENARLAARVATALAR
ncbi:MAG: pseudouridine-5'-phosphate glycosidase [Planctomycetota bacterium]|jgi:pseudouridine-5'-phosphate glycosidase